LTLIHVCCAPDLLSTVLKREFPEAVFYFYNPNIFPESEYEKRLEAFKTVCHRLNLNYMEGRYDPEEFSAFFERYFDEEEGGARCGKCMEMRLKNAALTSGKIHAKSFTSTLLASPRKSIDTINEIGMEISNVYGTEYTGGNFRTGRKEIKPYLEDIYVQNYCGCEASLVKSRRDREERERMDFELLSGKFRNLVHLWKYRGRLIRIEEIPIRDESSLKEFLAVLKPSGLLVKKGSELYGRNWLKAGKYNCRILGESDIYGESGQKN
jgi:predicted adenine nucleotide alpha hydrolase (AANH) superfamily ATPase